MKPKVAIILFLIILLAVAGGAYYFGYQKGFQLGRAAGQVKAGEAVTNPLEKMPSTNPFEKAVNPFKELYKNPFK